MGKLEDNKERILHWYTQDYLSANMIAQLLGVSRQGVIQALNGWGLDTSHVGNWVTVKCSYQACGRTYKIKKSQARRLKESKGNNFCGKDCWRKWKKSQSTHKVEQLNTIE
jgi:hypothetical protein